MSSHVWTMVYKDFGTESEQRRTSIVQVLATVILYSHITITITITITFAMEGFEF